MNIYCTNGMYEHERGINNVWLQLHVDIDGFSGTHT